jgi:ABC-type phosphate transport system substrate-binding protein
MFTRISIIFFCAIGFVQAADALRFTGSDLISVSLSRVVEDMNLDRDDQVQFSALGSLPALDQLKSGEVDIAVIAVPLGKSSPKEDFVVYPLAYSVSVVLLNEDNPTNELTLSQLGGIFGASEELQLQNWGELGLAGWTSRSFKPITAQREGDITVELFKHEVLKVSGLKTSVMQVKADELAPLIRGDLASIAVTTEKSTSSGVKELMISAGKDRPAYEASRDNVHFGDYPIRLPYFVVFKASDSARAKPLLQALFSNETAEIFESNGLVALPETVRRKLLIDLELTK